MNSSESTVSDGLDSVIVDVGIVVVVQAAVAAALMTISVVAAVLARDCKS